MPTPPTQPSDFDLKEVVTAAIALAIVTLLVIFLWQGFNAKTLEENQKYIIGIVLSLAGTVTGYYFGRVPAEKRADTAERAENDAKDGKAKSDAMVHDTRRTLDRVMAGGPREVEAQVQEVAAVPAGDAWTELNALRRRLS
jgi:hypothetical protein